MKNDRIPALLDKTLLLFKPKPRRLIKKFKRLFGGVCEKLEKDKDKARLPQSEEVKHFPSW